MSKAVYAGVDGTARKVKAMYVGAKERHAEGNPVQIVGDVEKFDSVEVSFLPVQAGSGTPSASNVRAITGHTNLYNSRFGKNLLRKWPGAYTDQGVTFTPLEDGGVHIGGTCTYSSGKGRMLTYKAFLGTIKGDFVLSMGNASAVSSPLDLRLADSTGRAVGGADVRASTPNANLQLHWDEGVHVYSYAIVYYGGYSYNVDLHPQLELGTTRTAFEKQTGNAYSFNLLDTEEDVGDAIYGGTLDLISGRVCVTHDCIASYAGESLPGEWISDRDVYAAGKVPTTGAQVVYALAEPRIYTISEFELTPLPDLNTIVSREGSLNVTYSEPGFTARKVTKGYVGINGVARQFWGA